VSSTVSTKSLPPPPIEVGWGANLQMDAAKNFLFVPIPAKAKKLGLLSIYQFSLVLQYPKFAPFPVPLDSSCTLLMTSFVILLRIYISY
jgi:hypothetical protein